MRIITFITGSFGSVFGGVYKFFIGFLDKASKWDDKETKSIARELSKICVYYKRDRYSTEMIFQYPKKDEYLPGREQE